MDDFHGYSHQCGLYQRSSPAGSRGAITSLAEIFHRTLIPLLTSTAHRSLETVQLHVVPWHANWGARRQKRSLARGVGAELRRWEGSSAALSQFDDAITDAATARDDGGETASEEGSAVPEPVTAQSQLDLLLGFTSTVSTRRTRPAAVPSREQPSGAAQGEGQREGGDTTILVARERVRDMRRQGLRKRSAPVPQRFRDASEPQAATQSSKRRP